MQKKSILGLFYLKDSRNDMLYAERKKESDGMGKNIVQVTGLSKNYKDKKAVDRLSLSIDKGDILGLVGPNGSGKSTTMKMLMMLIRKDEGEIKFYEESEVFMRKVGYASESSPFFMYMSGKDNLKMVANLYENVSDEKIDEVLELVGMSEAADKKVKTYSTGMKQRLGLARALLNDPELLVLDEPTNGLDPYGMKDIYEILEWLAAEKDVAILISSHLLHDIEKICNKIVMIENGKMLFNGDITELENGLEDSYYEMFRKNTV